MVTTLITGGAGFIGSHLAHSLLALGHDVYIVDNLLTGDPRNIPHDASFFCIPAETLNLTDHPWLRTVNHIFHFGGQSSAELSFRSPKQDFSSNLFSTVNLLDIASTISVESFHFASSVTVYDKDQPLPLTESSSASNRNSFYALSKLTSEFYIQMYSDRFHTSTYRFFNVYGPAQNLDNPDQGMLSIYLSQALRTKEFLIKGSLDRRRDFIHVFDIVQYLLKSLSLCHDTGKTFNLCTGIPTSVRTLLSMISSCLSEDFPITQLPSTPGDLFEHFGSPNLAELTFDYKPVYSLESGLRHTVHSYLTDSWFSTRLV